MVWLHIQVESKKIRKQNKREMTHRNIDQRDGCRGGGWGWVKKVKGNIVNNIVISLHGNR